MNRLNQFIVIVIFIIILFGCQPMKKEEFTEDDAKRVYNSLTLAQKAQYDSHDSCVGKEDGSSCNYCYNLGESGSSCMCENNKEKNIYVCRLTKEKQKELQSNSDEFCKKSENMGKACNYCGNDGDNNIIKKNCECKYDRSIESNTCQLK